MCHVSPNRSSSKTVNWSNCTFVQIGKRVLGLRLDNGTFQNLIRKRVKFFISQAFLVNIFAHAMRRRHEFWLQGLNFYFGEESRVYVPDGRRLYTAPSGIRAK